MSHSYLNVVIDHQYSSQVPVSPHSKSSVGDNGQEDFEEFLKYHNALRSARRRDCVRLWSWQIPFEVSVGLAVTSSGKNGQTSGLVEELEQRV